VTRTRDVSVRDRSVRSRQSAPRTRGQARILVLSRLK
jgi:hypothetical protein